MKLSLLAAALASSAFLLACSSEGGADLPGTGTGDPSTSNDPSADPSASGVDPLRVERPWEVLTDQGEMVLPDVFYADPEQNQQVMPTAIDGHDQIDRLIYPTLGNPNLYVSSDPRDSFLEVLRIEPDAIAHLAPDTSALVAGTQLHEVKLHGDAQNGIFFYLVARGGRGAATESTTAVKTVDGRNVIAVTPSAIRMSPMPPDMPAGLKARTTLRFVFDQSAMKAVPPGLYDVRFEVKKNGALVTRAGSASPIYEYQYNALRVFDRAPTNDEYQVVNVTDTQVSVGDLYDSKTTAKLTELVTFINQTSDPAVRGSAFITFNGDLHNGGSPGGVRERFVAMNYNNEAKVILAALKQLTLPIFLTAGNHDGYVSTGIVPQAIVDVDKLVFDSMQKVIGDFGPHPWPNFSYAAFDAYRAAIASQPGGFHRDIFEGAYVRRVADTFADGWQRLPDAQRNMVLYDGFNQWRRSYGPLYASWRWGRNEYVNVNSFDLRQHRRSGWGMYTVNYGGNVSEVQMDWLRRDVARASADGEDVVLLAHHDPRGGHHGKDYPYYFAQVDYHGMSQSAIAYLVGKEFNPLFCKLPNWALPESQELSCMHDGLQEWMRPDPELDCDDQDRAQDGTCRADLFDPKLGAQAHHLLYSGFELLDLVAKSPSVRTLLLGHTHYNAYEIAGPGAELIPATVTLDAAQQQALAAAEVQNPLRGASWWDVLTGQSGDDYDATKLAQQGIVDQNGYFAQQISAVAPTMTRTLQGDKRELMILRLTSNADLTSQTYAGKTMMGFSVMYFTHQDDARGVAEPQANRVRFFINAGNDTFATVRQVDLNRNVAVAAHAPGNPVAALFQGI